MLSSPSGCPAAPFPSFFWKRLAPLRPSIVTPTPTAGNECVGAAPPCVCCGSLVSYLDRFLIAFGGSSADHMSRDIYVYDLDHEERGWTRKATHHSEVVQARLIHSAVVYKDTMIVFGGRCMYTDWPSLILGDVLVLDLTTWTWAVVMEESPAAPEGPGPREFHSAHVVGDRMYVMMGFSTEEESPRCSNVWYLDLTRWTWREVRDVQCLSAAPRSSLVGHSTAIEGDTLYIFGGKSSRLGEEWSNDLHAFHFPTHSWRRFATASHPPARYGGALAVSNGVIFLYGGDCGTSYFGDFWCLDTRSTTPDWQEMPLDPAACPPTRSVSSRAPRNFLSRTDETESCRTAEKSVCGSSMLQLAPRSWGNLDRPTPRSGCSYTTARGALFVMGGEGFAPRDSGDSLLGFPAVIKDNTAVSYLNDLYMYPLGFSGQLSLLENAARWLSSAWAAESSMKVKEDVALVREREPQGVVAALRGCTSTALPW